MGLAPSCHSREFLSAGTFIVELLRISLLALHDVPYATIDDYWEKLTESGCRLLLVPRRDCQICMMQVRAELAMMSFQNPESRQLTTLLVTGALSTSNLALVVIDGSWSGPKKRTIFEMPEALTPSARFLARSGLKGRLVATPQTTSLVVF